MTASCPISHTQIQLAFQESSMGVPALDFSVKSRGLGELKSVAIYIVDGYLGTPSVSGVSSCVFYLQQPTTSNHPSSWPRDDKLFPSLRSFSTDQFLFLFLIPRLTLGPTRQPASPRSCFRTIFASSLPSACAFGDGPGETEMSHEYLSRL